MDSHTLKSSKSLDNNDFDNNDFDNNDFDNNDFDDDNELITANDNTQESILEQIDRKIVLKFMKEKKLHEHTYMVLMDI